MVNKNLYVCADDGRLYYLLSKPGVTDVCYTVFKPSYSKHHEKMEEFKSAELTVLPALLQKKEIIKAKLTTNLNIEDKLELEDQLRQIRIDIKINKKKKEKLFIR